MVYFLLHTILVLSNYFARYVQKVRKTHKLQINSIKYDTYVYPISMFFPSTDVILFAIIFKFLFNLSIFTSTVIIVPNKSKIFYSNKV